MYVHNIASILQCPFVHPILLVLVCSILVIVTMNWARADETENEDGERSISLVVSPLWRDENSRVPMPNCDWLGRWAMLNPRCMTMEGEGAYQIQH